MCVSYDLATQRGYRVLRTQSLKLQSMSLVVPPYTHTHTHTHRYRRDRTNMIKFRGTKQLNYQQKLYV